MCTNSLELIMINSGAGENWIFILLYTILNELTKKFPVYYRDKIKIFRTNFVDQDFHVDILRIYETYLNFAYVIVDILYYLV